MIQIYFDGVFINEDYYSSLSTNFELFESSFVLGSTPSNKFNISIDKTAVSNQPNEIIIKDNDALVATLVVDKIEDDNFYNYTLTDKMIDLEFKYDASKIFKNGSATLLQIAQDICNKAGIELATLHFRGCNKNISWYDNTLTAREYIGYIAELNSGYAQIGTDGKLYFVKHNTASATDISLDDCEDFSIGERHKITRVVYELGTLKYEFGDESGNTLYLNSDNVFITEKSEVEEIYNDLKDFTFYNFTTSNCPIDFNIKAGQIVTIIDENGNRYPTIVGYELTYYGDWYGGYSLDINSEKQEETKVIGAQEKIKSLKSVVDRNTNSITQLTQETSEHEEKIVQQQQDIDGIKQTVSNTAEYKRNAEGITEVHLEDAGQAEVLKLEVRGNKTYEANLFPGTNLYPGTALYPNTRR